jgi:hypothetical protein
VNNNCGKRFLGGTAAHIKSSCRRARTTPSSVTINKNLIVVAAQRIRACGESDS